VAPWCNPSKNFWSTHYETMKLSLTKRISIWHISDQSRPTALWFWH
jgi:hypothetical protein